VNVWLGRPPVFPEEAEELLANWHITHLFDNVLPVLKKAGITDEQLDGIFFENPKRLFGSSTGREKTATLSCSGRGRRPPVHEPDEVRDRSAFVRGPVTLPPARRGAGRRAR
jgi:hypothetical protein